MNDFWNGVFVDQDAFKKRFFSFLWRISWMVAASGIAFLTQSLGDFNLPPYIVIILGLVLGEISKWVNNAIKLGRAIGKAVPPEPVR